MALICGYPDRSGKTIHYGSRIVSFFKDEPIVGVILMDFI